MTNRLLQAIGERLYGPRWQTDLSRDIRVSDRTVRRWMSGEDDVAYGAWRDLYDRLGNRQVDIEHMRYRLSGLLGARAMTLKSIPNGTAEPDIYGVKFAMTTEDGSIVRCLVKRAFFDDHSITHPSTMVEFFNRYKHSFQMAASVKYDMQEFAGGMIVIDHDEIILMPDVLRGA